MTSYLPVLQYGSGEDKQLGCLSSSSSYCMTGDQQHHSACMGADDTADEGQSNEQHEHCRTEPQVQQQADPKSKTSSSHSGKGQAAVAKRGDRNAKKPKQQPDDSTKPDVMQELAKERKRRAFIGMLKCV